MKGIDREKLRCWHGSLLYECEDPEHSTPMAMAGPVDCELVTLPRYRGSCVIYTTITDRGSDMYGAQSIEPFECEGHLHMTRTQAQECISRRVRAEVRRRDRAVAGARREDDRQ